MDPVSITAACVSLTATITKTSVTVISFVRSVRAARNDLDGVSRELASLKTLLELIAEDAEDVENFPETLRKHIISIVANCDLVLVEVQRLVEKYSAPGVLKSSKWALAGSEDVAKLQLSLEAHKSALEIALEMVALSVTKQIKADTSEILDDTAAIKQDTSDILQEIARLRAQLPDDLGTLRPTFQEPDTNLARYLDDLTSYAETVCWSGEDSDTDDEKTANAEESTLTSTPPPSQHRKSSLDPMKTSTKELNSQISDEIKSQTAQTMKPDELSSRYSPNPPAKAQGRSMDLPRPREIQALSQVEALKSDSDEQVPDMAVKDLRTTPHTPQGTKQSPQPLDLVIQKKSPSPALQASHHLPRVPTREPRKLSVIEQGTRAAASHGVGLSESNSDDESQETRKTKVPPAFTNHITDLESRLDGLREQRSFLEERLWKWSSGVVSMTVDGRDRSKKWHEEQLAETRRHENDVGWTLRQARTEKEKGNPTPVSDRWFRMVMTASKDASNFHADDVRPQMTNERAQQSRGNTYNDQDDIEGVTRVSSSSAQQMGSETIKRDTTSPISPRSRFEVRPRVPEEVNTSASDTLQVDASVPGELDKGTASDVHSKSKEDKTALIQPGYTMTASNQRTTVASIYGTWDIGSLIRSGSRGYITDARSSVAQCIIYIKTYKRDTATDQRIAREVAVDSVLRHGCIRNIWACVQSDSHWYLEIDWREQSLAERIHSTGGRLEPRVAQHFAKRIASAIAYCHAHCIVHLNLDITKVLVTSDDKVNVTGFGHLVTSAGYLSQEGVETLSGVRRKFIADPDKVPPPAPEVFKTREPGRDGCKIDVWSFGIIIWNMLKTEPPTDENITNIMPNVGPLLRGYEQLLSKMLTADPNVRLTIEEVGRDPWITYRPPLDTYIPLREPLGLPLDPAVVREFHNLRFFGWWSEYGLSTLIESRKYQQATEEWQKIKQVSDSVSTTIVTKRNIFGIKRREIMRTAPVSVDKNFFSILRNLDGYGEAALYYLVQEKLQRDAARQKE